MLSKTDTTPMGFTLVSSLLVLNRYYRDKCCCISQGIDLVKFLVITNFFLFFPLDFWTYDHVTKWRTECRWRNSNLSVKSDIIHRRFSRNKYVNLTLSSSVLLSGLARAYTRIFPFISSTMLSYFLRNIYELKNLLAPLSSIKNSTNTKIVTWQEIYL